MPRAPTAVAAVARRVRVSPLLDGTPGTPIGLLWVDFWSLSVHFPDGWGPGAGRHGTPRDRAGDHDPALALPPPVPQGQPDGVLAAAPACPSAAPGVPCAPGASHAPAGSRRHPDRKEIGSSGCVHDGFLAAARPGAAGRVPPPGPAARPTVPGGAREEPPFRRLSKAAGRAGSGVVSSPGAPQVPAAPADSGLVCDGRTAPFQGRTGAVGAYGFGQLAAPERPVPPRHPDRLRPRPTVRTSPGPCRTSLRPAR